VDTVRSRGSAALGFCYVAAGWADAYFQYTLKSWYVAAGALLVQEAGGVVMDIAGGDRWLQSGHILAAPFKLITPMRKAIEPHLTESLIAKTRAAD
jgi:myo-inositol-1(or 4)-monophosphatase